MERTCRICGTSNQAAFYDPKTTSGIAAGNCCRACWTAKSVAWRAANRESWNAKNHKRAAMRSYGMSAEEYDTLYLNAACAGCGAPEGAPRTFRNGIVRTSRLTIDHDHVTGKARGLLCHDCNRTIATAHDNPATLRALASYVETP